MYGFIKHSQPKKDELSAIYRQLMKKGYSHQRTFQPAKQIKDVDIRKVLDHPAKQILTSIQKHGIDMYC